ncbi:MFS general substrate transporter [Decorospora gaudefroyi]|uniref:MFS general substrate transporter n=1 Tax=Decorospora gaudefroyi TaxID=184978 RepID=A0A6A5JY13_9PLEO|nr:MFS general substrate transporter [Decorospora gaudefroyi]
MATTKDEASRGDHINTIDEKKETLQENTDLENENGLEQQTSEPPWSVFSKRMKIWIIFLVSVSALISPFGASMFLPALNVLSDVLEISPTQVNISITTYMVCLAHIEIANRMAWTERPNFFMKIAQAIAPAFLGTLSDTSGRRLTFIICFVVFSIGNIGLALQTNYIALLILRMVQAVGGTAAIALSMAVVADVATSAERGTYMGYAGAGILMGPAFGPTIGGLLAKYLGWRSIFWFLAIFSGLLCVVFVFLFPETCRNVVGNGSVSPQGVNCSVISYMQQRKLVKLTPDRIMPKPKRPKTPWPNPLVTFRILAEKESGILLFYNGLFFTGMMVTVSAMPELFYAAYGFDELHIGLCYVSNGVASLISSLTMGRIVDWNFRRHAKAMGMEIIEGKQQDLSHFPIERVRLQVVITGHILGIIGMVLFGWTLQCKTHIVGPEVALFIMGFGVTSAFNITNGLLIELHRGQAAAATAAVNFARCLMSAGGTAAIIPMCRAMGVGWAFTFIACVYVGLLGVVFWIMKEGMGWRIDLDEKKRVKKEQEERKRPKGEDSFA